MKRKFLAVLTALAVLTMGSMTVSAASPTVGTTEAPVSTQKAITSVEAVAAPGAYLSRTTVSTGFAVSAVSATTVQAASVAVQNAILNDIASTASLLGNQALANAAANAESRVTASILTVVEVKASNASKDAGGKYVVTLSLSGISAGDAVAVLHYTGSAWETIVPESVANGSVTFKSASLSPIAVVKLSTTTVSLSPKTGSTVPAAAVVLIVSAIGMAVCGKRYFA
ncbi:MAG: hypothetical protein NC341_08180 [Blautia sp.]|nr:hypothetical protein [Blautia sp.]MCM1201368.1 hypothetical protein [Bacteroides fragilis]